MSRSSIVVAYDPTWPTRFADLAAILTPALGGLASGIHHVGSTAIPGMPAKPIIDIDIALAPHASIAAATKALTPLGYEYQGDQGIPDRYAYANVSPVWPHHLYVCPYGSQELARHLLFRDKLRESEALRQQYTEVKRRALELAQGVRQVYVEEKARLGAEFFRLVLEAPGQ